MFFSWKKIVKKSKQKSLIARGKKAKTLGLIAPNPSKRVGA